jgi:hypothetical protein
MDTEVGAAVRQLADLKKREACLQRRLKSCIDQLEAVAEGTAYDGVNYPKVSGQPVDDANALVEVRRKVFDAERFLNKQGLGHLTGR